MLYCQVEDNRQEVCLEGVADSFFFAQHVVSTEKMDCGSGPTSCQTKSKRQKAVYRLVSAPQCGTAKYVLGYGQNSRR